MKFPDHKCGLYLTHNEHRDVYEKLDEWIESDKSNWESEAQKQRAIDTDECWVLQWYPNTPIGFFRIAAPTLEDLLRFAHEGIGL